MEINVVTSNHGKFLEIKEILEKDGIESFHTSMNISEEGNTLEERCVSKAKNAFSAVKRPLIVDDTGLFFKDFKNFPGAFPKKVFRELGFEGIMKKLEGKNRNAYFKTIICYIDRNGIKLFEGSAEGKISKKVFGGWNESLPYDKILIPKGHEIPFCMLSTEEKNMISHRAKAAEKFAKWFSSRH